MEVTTDNPDEWLRDHPDKRRVPDSPMRLLWVMEVEDRPELVVPEAPLREHDAAMRSAREEARDAAL